jgi:hypothetical protein
MPRSLGDISVIKEEIWMNQHLYNAALELVVKAREKGRIGKTADDMSLNRLQNEIRNIPRWLTQLLGTVPLCGLEIGWQAWEPEESYDGFEWMEINTPQSILNESLDYIPGVYVLEKGYICFAGDSMGGGNPYFIPVNQSDDPPIYQLHHDVSNEPHEILRKARLVFPKLSELFTHGKV